MRKTILSLLLILIISICLTGCASWDNISKDWESEFGNGLERKVKVYSQNGELLAEYEGKIDIEYDSDRVLFQIDRNKRVGIYSKTATVVVEEK